MLQRKKLASIIAASIVMATTSTTTLADPEVFSRKLDGTPFDPAAAVISQNGRYIAYSFISGSDYTNQSIFLYDRKTGDRRVIASDVPAYILSGERNWDLSGSGKYLAVQITNEETGYKTIKLIDLQSGLEKEISVSYDGRPTTGSSFHPRISSTGDYLTFYSTADNIVEIDPNGHSLNTFVHNVSSETTFIAGDAIGRTNDYREASPKISANGNVVFSSNGFESEFSLVNLSTESRTLLDSNISGRGKNYSQLSTDGRFALFQKIEYGTDLPDHELFVYDSTAGIQSIFSVSSDGSQTPTRIIHGVSNGSVGGGQFFDVSGDGQFIVFASQDDYLVPDDADGNTDVFVFDRVNHQTRKVNTVEGDGLSSPTNITISEDGHYITYGAYVINNPLYVGEYCEGYQEF